MRRLIHALTIALASFALVACEDGPNQTYQPSPAGAAGNWNNGGTGPSTDPGSQAVDLDAGGGGATKQDLCPGQKLHDTWAAMVKNPIKPPRLGAGIDMAGGDTWPGITIEDAEKLNCQTLPTGTDGLVYWGDNAEVVVRYYITTHKIYYLGYDPGYIGKIDFQSRDKQDKYSIGVNAKIQKNGAPLTLDWSGVPSNPNQKLKTDIEAMVDALFATFTPGLPAEPHCFATGHCKAATFSDGSGYMFVPAIGWAFRVASITAPQPTPSVVYYMDEYLEKVLPFSYATPLAKLDDEGPTASSTNLGKGRNCTLRLTSDQNQLFYKDFLSNCVQVTGDTTADGTELNKLLGGLQHGTERFFFDVSGVDINFSDRSLPDDRIVTDFDRPSNNDEATQLNIDQSTLGPMANEYANNDATSANAVQDNHGSGLVYLEFARLVQEYLQQFRPAGAPLRTLGDPACLAPNLAYLADGTVDPTKPIPAGCTGFEGFATLAPKALVKGSKDPTLQRIAYDRQTLLDAASKDKNADADLITRSLSLGIKPGSPVAVFCGKADDGTGLPAMCNTGTLWDGAFQRVIQIFGHGQVSQLPTEVQDRRFFWRMYATAMFEYLMVAGTPTATIDDFRADANKLQANDLFFDSVGSGQFEQAEYVDRRYVSGGQTPTDINITADILNGIFDELTFSREAYRGEELLYMGVQCQTSDPTACAPNDYKYPALGQEEDRALLTNMFGSPVLATAFSDVLAPDGTTAATAYHCATTVDAKNCGAQMPPIVASDVTCAQNADCPAAYPFCAQAGMCVDVVRDDSQNPLLAGYPGAIGTKKTIFTLGNSTMKIINPGQYDNIQSQMVEFRFHQDPYDTTSPYAGKAVDRLVPYLPKQPGVGFPIPLDGVHDKFINTYAVDLSGTTISANLDYDFDAKGGVVVKAVESTDFLGDVFVCRDKGTGDILPARMYSSVKTILDWFAAHPGAYDDCQMITRYSPYDNYADYITSLVNGVRLSVTQGGGYGRIVDVILWDAALGL